jgi:hypothetical protein
VRAIAALEGERMQLAARIEVIDTALTVLRESDAAIGRGASWSPDDERKLLELFDAHTPWERVARELNRSVGACKGKVSAMRGSRDKRRATIQRLPRREPDPEPVRTTPAPRRCIAPGCGRSFISRNSNERTCPTCRTK